MRDTLRRVVVVGVLAVAGFAMYLAMTRGRDERPPTRSGAVTRVFPQSDAVALRQDAVGADLAFGYTGELAIDDHPIPLDQLQQVAAGNGLRISFTPGNGKEFERLDAGRHCATVSYTTTTPGTSAAGSSYTWCFIAS
ncbi:MAG TPA: hypothetical protein VHN98_06535 [Acidimicrobiales bacterium]|nr:hypothetical protein [Acidimicrobiales bacterium]